MGVKALQDIDYARRSRALIQKNRATLQDRLNSIAGLTAFTGAANFLLLRLDVTGITAGDVTECLLREKIAVRNCSNFQGLGDRYLRVAVRGEAENDRLLGSLHNVLSGVRV